MVQHVRTTSTLSAAIPKGRNQKIDVQKRFFSTKRKTQKRNIRLEKPNKEEQMEMIENWKNDEQSEQNNIKVPVDFTSQNDGAQGNSGYSLKAVRRLIVPSLRIVKATRHDSVRELLPLV